MSAAVLMEPKTRPALERRILDYFQQNPECELNPKLIQEKFGCSNGTAMNTLTAMRQRGLITTHHIVRPTPQALTLTSDRASACAGKAVFATMQRAKDRAARMRQRYDIAVSPYRCEHCGEIHLGGAKPERKQKDMEAEE